jgi:rhodanese-related sulfurtransferase
MVVKTISPVNAARLLRTDPAVVLVCAYGRDELFHQYRLEGAISLKEFRRRLQSLPKDENVIFYCACPHGESAKRQAEECQERGFLNAQVLDGGVDAWKAAGFSVIESAAAAL